MYATEDSWDADDDHETSGIVNNPLSRENPTQSSLAHHIGV
jgi:hypothetical protein